MLDLIAKYWVQWLCALIAAAATAWAKHYIKLEKEENVKKQKERMSELRTEVKDEVLKELDREVTELKQEDEKLYNQIDEVKGSIVNMSTGVLSIQGRDFKNDCRQLLREEHKISLEEFESLEEAHEVYNLLGGNHKGDELFSAVRTKYMSQLGK